MNRNDEIRKIVEEVGEDLIWRPLYDFENNSLADGVGQDIDGIDPECTALDFKGKTVCDLGCNTGHFSFHAARQEALEVVGYDMEPRVVSGATRLAELYDVDNVDFKVCNFAYEDPDRTFDLGMLIDILGKVNIARGHLVPILKGLEKRSESEMLLTFRPVYYVNMHLKMSEDDFLRLYPQARIEDGLFSLLAFAEDLFAEKWRLSYVSRDLPGDSQYKKTVYFVRR